MLTTTYSKLTGTVSPQILPPSRSLVRIPTPVTKANTHTRYHTHARAAGNPVAWQWWYPILCTGQVRFAWIK